MVYTIEQIKEIVKTVADQYDILEIRLFGSYFDGRATTDSDLDFVVQYGPNCKGLECIRFINDLELTLMKPIDVVNILFQPDFMKNLNMDNEKRIIYKNSDANNNFFDINEITYFSV